jgi:hypothetical protein
MSIQVRAQPYPKYLKITLTGEFNAAEIPETADRFLELCGQHQKENVLADVFALQGNPSFLERFTLATVFATKYIRARMTHQVPPCLFAVVGNHPMVDERKFEENVAKNRGTPVKTFTDLKEALAWLGVAQEDGSKGF